MRLKIDSLEKLIKNKHVKRDQLYQERTKISHLVDDSKLVAETNAHHYEALQRKKEELVGKYRTVNENQGDPEEGVQLPYESVAQLDGMLHALELNLEETSRNGQDAVNLYKQHTLQQQIAQQEYQKLQNEITVLSGMKGITQHNFRLYKTIQDKISDGKEQKNELSLVKEIYTLNDQLGKFVGNLKDSLGSTDIYPQLQENLPTQVQIDRPKDSGTVGSVPLWIAEIRDISSKQKQSVLKT